MPRPVNLPSRRVVAIVPALDEAATVASVVRAALAVVDAVVVIDDGSTDDTGSIARDAGASVVRHGRNLGVGAAISSGLTAAREAGADVVVQLDGDGQHDAGFVTALVERIDRGADLVIGTRFEMGFEMGRVRRTMLRSFAWVIERRIGVPVSDPTSGFRAFSGRAADALAPIFPHKYLSDTVEVLFLAHEAGLSVETVPVTMRQREAGTASVGPLRGTLYALRVLGVLGAHTFRRPRRRAH